MYWFSRAGPAASLRIYYEMSGGGTKGGVGVLSDVKWTNVPVGVSHFPREVFRLPKSCVTSFMIALFTVSLTERT